VVYLRSIRRRAAALGLIKLRPVLEHHHIAADGAAARLLRVQLLIDLDSDAMPRLQRVAPERHLSLDRLAMQPGVVAEIRAPTRIDRLRCGLRNLRELRWLE